MKISEVNKASKDFKNWYLEKYHSSVRKDDTSLRNFYLLAFTSKPKVERLSYFIEFYDNLNLWEDIFYKEYRATRFKDYKKSIEQALKKAKEIYNEQTK